MWGDYSDSWWPGVANATLWVFEHNHPDIGYSIESLGACYSDAPEGYREEVIVDVSSIYNTDDWVMPGLSAVPSPLDGVVPSGRLYAVQVEFVYISPRFEPITEPAEVHVAIISDGDTDGAQFFIGGC